MSKITGISEKVLTVSKKISSYEDIIGKSKIDNLKELAKPLYGKKILHLNATAYGGGVAELLKTQVPLLNDLGMEVDWRVLNAEPEFYDVTKKFHNTLQGSAGTLNNDEKEIYLENVKNNVSDILNEYDYVIAHDPQTVALLSYIPTHKGKWIWRCHIDTSVPNKEVWNFLYPYMQDYDAVIFTLDEFVNEQAKFNNLTFIPPSIDPLSPKNIEMPENKVRSILKKYNTDPDRPIITQISRFDPWKDPFGVIDVYRNIKIEDVKYGINGLQLALIGSMANDDPEGWSIYDRVLRRAGDDYEIKIYTNLHGIGDKEVKAFQSASDVILQKSLKEGFGLTVAEALWKEKPVIGGKVGGIKIQINDGKNGYLVSSIQEATEKTLYLLQNPEEAKAMGKAGKETVREKFLSTREIEDHLVLFNKLANRTYAGSTN